MRNEGAARPRKRTTTLTVVVTMTRRRCNYDRVFSQPASHLVPLSISIFFLFLLLFYPSHTLRRGERRMIARRDHEEHEDMTMKSTKMTGRTDRGRARLTFVVGLTFSNDGIRRVNREHEMSVRIEMIFANDHNG